MNAPADFSIPTNVLSIHHTLLLLVFSFIFLLLLLIISIMRVCSESVLKSVFFSIFVMERLYSTLKTILRRQ